MKRYKVIVTPEAEFSIRESFLYIFARSPLNAERWIRSLYAEIDTLETFPERCAFALEREYLEMDLRQLLFKSHRVVFSVIRRVVRSGCMKYGMQSEEPLEKPFLNTRPKSHDERKLAPVPKRGGFGTW